MSITNVTTPTANLSLNMTSQEKSKLNKEVRAINIQNDTKGIEGKKEANKDQFLKLLTVQLSHQDPLAPMKNTEFIAQMAQFTALEQMKNMNQAMDMLRSDFNKMQVSEMLSKKINYYDVTSETVQQGIVERVNLKENTVSVEGNEVDVSDIHNIVAE